VTKNTKNHGLNNTTPKSTAARRTEESQRQRRRALLTAISAAGVAGGTELPRQWARPIVDHVLLPAHAQTSLQAEGCEVTCTLALLPTFQTSDAGAGLVDVTLSIDFLATCEREPDGERVSASAGESSSSVMSSAATGFLTTYSSIQTMGSGAFSGGSECELPLSELAEIEVTPVDT